MKSVKFDKNKTIVIKGIAILFMIMHHCLIPAFYDNPSIILNNVFIIHFMMGMKICVGLFTFIIGYGYAFSKDHSYFYGFKHIGRLLMKFWGVMILIFIPVALNGGYSDYHSLILELFGLKSALNCASWYIYFYICIMLLLPILAKFINASVIRNSVFLIILCGLIAGYLGEMKNLYMRALYNCLFYLPVLIVGYCVAKLHIFERIKIKNEYIIIFILLVTLGGRCAVSSIKGFSMDIVCVPIFIYCLITPFCFSKLKYLERLLIPLGDKSLYMWFLHALFYSVAVRYAFAKYVLWPNSLIISYILIVFMSYVLSFLCMWVEKRLQLLNK